MPHSTPRLSLVSGLLGSESPYFARELPFSPFCELRLGVCDASGRMCMSLLLFLFACDYLSVFCFAPPAVVPQLLHRLREETDRSYQRRTTHASKPRPFPPAQHPAHADSIPPFAALFASSSSSSSLAFASAARRSARLDLTESETALACLVGSSEHEPDHISRSKRQAHRGRSHVPLSRPRRWSRRARGGLAPPRPAPPRSPSRCSGDTGGGKVKR